ncbi:MAG: glycosyl transferase [Kaistia sp. SCN 65-12]|nr:MAG: glycosyl transferase [Kaistia sp. SCN 65-12]
MIDYQITLPTILIGLFVLSQGLYLMAFAIDLYLFSLPVNRVNMDEAEYLQPDEFPFIVLFYPVLKELEATMRTTLTSLAELDYPRDRYRVIAIPNSDDIETIASLERLQGEFPFLQLIRVPPTSDRTWNVVWNAWQRNDKAYWWHSGQRAYNRDLPPKKTRQLIYAFYTMVAEVGGREDFLIDYIDADSCPPRDHLLAAAVGIRRYDVLQAKNVAGNLNASMAASWHAFDHMAWDGMKYPHLSSNGRQPYWVLGKGTIFRASDLVALGGFHPWLTIEDPEVGMRFWVNGKRLGIIENSLIEEVPSTLMRGITQRKRWVAGFFQSLGSPLRSMGMTRWQRFKAWLIFMPCLSLSLNAFGIPIGIWALWTWLDGTSVMPEWTIGLAAFNVATYAVMLSALYWSTWKRTALVLTSTRARLWYMLRVNPVSLAIWWLIWLVPLWIGYRMYVQDKGLVWERTEKINANEPLMLELRR